MLSRTKVLLSIALPAVAVTAIVLAFLWHHKDKDAPSTKSGQSQTKEDLKTSSKETLNEEEFAYVDEKESTKTQFPRESHENSSVDSKRPEEDLDYCAVETIPDDFEQMAEEEDSREYDNNDTKQLNVVDSKNTRERRESKKSSWSTIDSGVELTKQPSFELKDYLFGEETLSEGSGDSVALSSYTETPIDMMGISEASDSEKMVWEVEFPQILCGRLIGRKGKNVKVISDNAGAKIRLIPQSPGEVSTHRIISISGDCTQIKSALDAIHERFPAVPLNRINASTSSQASTMAAPIVSPLAIATPVPYVQAVLPNMVNFNVVVTSVLDANHFFIQLHNDAVQAQLQQLHQTMLECYSQEAAVPLSLPLPQPLMVGSYCAAPAFTYDGWYRAQVLGSTGNADEVQVKYLDYGGYGRITASSLRHLRSDFLSYLPFQAVECYLANVAPLNGDSFSLVASAVLEDLTMNCVLTARVLGHRNQLPCLELYLVQCQQTLMVNRELVNRGLARWVES